MTHSITFKIIRIYFKNSNFIDNKNKNKNYSKLLSNWVLLMPSIHFISFVKDARFLQLHNRHWLFFGSHSCTFDIIGFEWLPNEFLWYCAYHVDCNFLIKADVARVNFYAVWHEFVKLWLLCNLLTNIFT